MIKLKDIFFMIVGVGAVGKEYFLGYTSSPQHAIKESLNNGWTIDQLKVIPICRI